MSTDLREAALLGGGVTERTDETPPCFDPECSGQGEPEQDGAHAYYTCNECGSDFGWHRLENVGVGAAGETCSIGVPEDVRRAMSGPMEAALRADQTKDDVIPTGARKLRLL